MSKPSAAHRAALKRTAKILIEVHEERFRQDILVANGTHQFNCSNHVGNLRKLPILMEEVGEAAKEVYELDTTPVIEIPRRKEIKGRLRMELIQVAAVCVAWVEALTEDMNT